MTRYFFDIQIGDAPRSVDEEGEEYPDIASVRREAGSALCGLAKDIEDLSGGATNIAIWVRDEYGEVLCAKLKIAIKRLN